MIESEINEELTEMLRLYEVSRAQKRGKTAQTIN